MKYKAHEAVEEYKSLATIYKEEVEYALLRGEVEDAKEFMRKYLKEIQEKRIVLKKKEEEKYLILEYKTRFSKRYKREIKEKIRNMLEGINTTCGHLVLTIENLSFEELAEKKEKISRALFLFFRKVERAFKKKIQRVVTREVTETKDKKFHFHFHCLLIGMKFLTKKELEFIKKIWKETTESQGIRGEYAYYKYLKNKNIFIWYITKYIIKDLETVNLTSTSLTILKMRSYTTTLKKKDKIETEEDLKEYEFYGVLSKEEVEEFIKNNKEKITNIRELEKEMKEDQENSRTESTTR